MSIDVSQPPAPPRKGWVARLLGRWGEQPSAGNGSSSGGRAEAELPRGSIRDAARQLISQERYTFVLLRAAEEHIEPRHAAPAWEALQQKMGLVPGGMMPVVCADGRVEMTEIPAFYLDRNPVTNRQFQRFVAAGCYDNLEIWPKEVWPSLMRFTDRNGCPGPAYWEHGSYPSGKANHPVVGVSWFEALAFARWVGKRLATAAEWQKAGGWPEQLSGGHCNRYPWGNLFDPARANLWSSNVGDTVAIDAVPGGTTPNGIQQLSGNVWEWLDDPLETIPCEPDETFETWRPLRRIIGGAFDTYFPAEATCQFITGQPELDRRPNLGFRCVVLASELRDLD